jgi:peroxiredoxin Q/BCP
VGKDGEVLAVEAGGPAATVEVVRKLVEAQGGETAAAEGEEKKEAETEKMAETAAEVADVAEDLDGTPAAA